MLTSSLRQLTLPDILRKHRRKNNKPAAPGAEYGCVESVVIHTVVPHTFFNLVSVLIS